MKKTTLVMVGYEREGSENFSLRLVGRAAVEAGFNVSVCTASSLLNAPGVVKKAVALKSTVLGFVCNDAHSAIHSLGLAQLAGKMGYTGYIVCFGEFATLQPDLILERASAVDAVLRHDSADGLVKLLNAFEEGSDLSLVPALYTRAFNTPPSLTGPDFRWRPIRGELPTVMGIKTAAVIGSRGCLSKCEYCTHAAVEKMYAKEALKNGPSSANIKRARHGGQHRRDISDLADEMAELYHEKNVRYFGFSDENIVPQKEPAALDWAGEFNDALLERGMTDVSMGFMTRADCITDKVADALVNLGLVRTLTGIESGNQKSLAALGRNGNAQKGQQGLENLVNRNVVTLFNNIIFHPETTVASIHHELEFLKGVKGALFDTVQAVPFAGTELGDRMARENRLIGGRIIPAFKVNDPVLAQFSVLLTRLQTYVFGAYSPALRAHDLMFSAALAARYGINKERALEKLNSLNALANRINSAKVETLLELLNVSINRGNAYNVIETAKERFSALERALDAATIDLKKIAQSDAGSMSANQSNDSNKRGLALSKTYANFAAAAGLLFVVSGTTGCYHVSPLSDDTEIVAGTDTTNDRDTTIDRETAIGSQTGNWIENCKDSDSEDVVPELEYYIKTNCLSQGPADTLLLTIDENGKVQTVSNANLSADTAPLTELIQCVQDLLKDEVFPCLKGEEFQVWVSYPVIKGII